MDVSILADIISDIIGYTNGLTSKQSEGDMKQIENHLREILEAVEKAQHIPSQSSKLVTWVRNVKEVVNDVDYLMEDLCHKKSPTSAALDRKSSQSITRKTSLPIGNPSICGITFRTASQYVETHSPDVTQSIETVRDKLKSLASDGQKLSFSEEEKNKKEITIGGEKEKKDIIDQPDESWSLFQQIRGQILSSNNKEQDNEKEIVKDCGGVPRAIITLARLLNSRGSQVVKPEEVAAFKDFVQKQHHYFELPTHQKLCFAYFSLFPSRSIDAGSIDADSIDAGYIDAEFLIRLWMAEGFLARNISSNDYKQQEERGRECLKQFDHHFFEKVKEDESGVITSCKMKPLMHDLARVVAKDENIIMDSGVKKFDSGVLRASFDFDLDVSCGIPDSLFEKAKKLRTILLLAETNKGRLPHEVKMTASTCDKLLNSFKYLRLLDLHDLGLTTVPNSIGEMKHLRYLDMSNNNIEKLPSCITQLSHLQTLKLSHCHTLKELPKDLEDLSDLVHLDIQGCLDLTHMPHGIRKLTSLQTLSLFAASQIYMGGLEELMGLNNIRGKLEIIHLEQMKIPSNPPKCLNLKEHLQQLTLRWEHYDDEEEEEKEKDKKKGNESRSKKDGKDEDERSLNCLVPHQNLKALHVEGYNGQRISNWLSSVVGLVKLCLTDCHGCKYLPPSLDKLSNLKVLKLWRLDSLQYIAEQSDTPINDAPFILTSLEELTISDCPELVGWREGKKWEKGQQGIPVFTRISKLHVRCCPKLDYMPVYPYLDKELVMEDSSVVPMQHTNATELRGFLPFSNLKSMLIERIQKSPDFFNFTSLENLHICDCRDFKFLPQGFKSMKSLKYLIIEKCPELDLDLDRSGTEWEGLEKLHSLTIGEIPSLKSLPRGIEHVTSLKHLELNRCYGLTSLDGIGHLTSLNKLVISKCQRLRSLPEEMKELKSLSTLKIMDCPLLTPRCQEDTGDDWPQIKHIKTITVWQTSQDFSKCFYFGM